MNGKQHIVILGIGSDFGDDQLGLIAANRLAEQLPQCHVQALRSPLDLCDYVADTDQLHIIDACRGSGLSGSLSCHDWRSTTFQGVRFSGTHDFDLIAALKLAERLVGLPSRVLIWSIEAADTERVVPNSMHAPLSPQVADATKELVARIVAEVNRTEAITKEATGHA